MLTEKQLREIDEHYLKFTIFGRTFSWFNTSPLRIYNHIQRVKKSVDLADVVGSEERAELVCGFCGTNKAEVCFKCHTNECVSAAGQN
jgi:hypothetical protein